MSHRYTNYLLLSLLVLVAGCGSSASTSPTTKTNPKASTGATRSPLDAWVVEGDEEPGYVGAGTTTDATAHQFSESSAEADALRRDGYRSALTEQMNPSNASTPGGAVSWVMELRSPALALRAQAYELRSVVSSQGGPPTVIKRFTVAGVPDAEGFTATGPGGPGAANVVFAEGSCVLLIGDYEPTGSLSAPLKHAALAIYRRTHGSCP